jgi:uncharacterized damage-inducible protein DinB
LLLAYSPYCEELLMNAATLNDLFRHMEWADATVWIAVLASPKACGDAKLKELLYHLDLVQRSFLRVWRGEPREAAYPTFEEAGALMQWARSYYSEAQSHLAGLSDEDISQAMPVPWAALVEKRLGRAPATTSVGETALQVVLHSTYHRGQVNARLREVGGTPPLVDYIAWVWLGRPEADWTVVSSANP